MSIFTPVDSSKIQSQKWNPESLHSVQSILDMEKYNGRINLMDLPDKDTLFNMFEKVAIKNKSTEYRNPVVGILEDNMLEKVFFSSGNIQILQNGLRAGVYNMSKDKKIILPPQNIDHLKIIMRSMYLQYAEHRHDTSVTKQVEDLNKIVLDYVVPMLYGEAMGYMKYLEDQSTLVRPLALPNLIDRDYKQLEMKPWF
jgi:hypothetical protein